MGRLLVLVRHGKAERSEAFVSDEMRKLTKPGARACEARFARVPALLDEDDRDGVAIMSSRAVRAMRTAEILADALDCGPVVENEGLLVQDIDNFLDGFWLSDSRTVIAVGHNPFMEEILELLTGASLHMEPGAVAAVRMGDAPHSDEEHARLEWVLQGPDVERWKTLRFLEKMLSKACSKVERLHGKFVERPDDPEALHDLRVSIRTARSLIGFCSPFLSKPSQRRAVEALRSIVLKTSRLREIDVLIEEVSQMDPPADELMAECVAARDAEMDEVLKALTSGKTAKRLKIIRRFAGSPCWKRSIERSGLDPDAIPMRFHEMLEDVRELSSSTDLDDVEEMHRLRKSAKKMRYIAENASAYLDPDDAAQVEREMIAVQDRLGKLCDAHVNIDIIDSIDTKGLSEECRRDLLILKARSAEFIRSFQLGG